MNWSNIWLIFQRELRDQLRDRRTIFTIAVLPLILYPLLGISFFQIAQFQRKHTSKIWVIGADALPSDPTLLQSDGFDEQLVGAETTERMHVVVDGTVPPIPVDSDLNDVIENAIRSGNYDAVIHFPKSFGDQLETFQNRLVTAKEDDALATDEVTALQPPRPEVYVSLDNDKSKIASQRIQNVMRSWRELIVQQTLADSNVPVAATQPFVFDTHDISQESSRRAAFWAKLLPFILLVWALTGAFYPAVDLCAGEKERGTLETLLSSPAGRGEIVWGKLLTIIVFSMGTSLLNLASMGLTGGMMMQQMQGMTGGAAIGVPPVMAIVWLVVALIPIAALFSALALAISAFARSTKEGQYYLMPLLIITLPLMILPMMPSVELDWTQSFIPVTGMMLLLQSLIMGDFTTAARFALPVLAVTSLCCGLAIRWAIHQFNSESVLFRESERWDLNLWLRHTIRNRGNTPGVTKAILCGVFILMARFYAGSLAGTPDSWSSFATATLITLIGMIALPAVIMAFTLTRSPRQTLMLSRPKLWTIPMAIVLAIVIHPVAMAFADLVKIAVPMSDEVAIQLQRVSAQLGDAPNIWVVLMLIGVAPAICEELAFRGFILTGLRDSGNKWVAIVGSSLFFGVAHMLLQQSITACAVGLIIGFVAFQTKSIWPGMLFHLTYNSLSVLMGFTLPGIMEAVPAMQLFFEVSDAGIHYQGYLVAAGGLMSMAILLRYQALTATSSSPQQQVILSPSPASVS